MGADATCLQKFAGKFIGDFDLAGFGCLAPGNSRQGFNEAAGTYFS